MQMRSQCFYSVVMTNSKLDYCHSGGILSLSNNFFLFAFMISLLLSIFAFFSSVAR